MFNMRILVSNIALCTGNIQNKQILVFLITYNKKSLYEVTHVNLLVIVIISLSIYIWKYAYHKHIQWRKKQTLALMKREPGKIWDLKTLSKFKLESLRRFQLGSRCSLLFLIMPFWQWKTCSSLTEDLPDVTCIYLRCLEGQRKQVYELISRTTEP